jgi:hypothetical protein
VALLLGVALAGYPLAGADAATPALVVLAGLAVVVVAVSLLWRPLPGVVLAALAVELVVRDVDARLPSAQAIGYGVGLLLLCELIALSDTLRSRALVARGVLGRRAGNLLLALLVGAGAAAITVAAGDVDAPNDFVAGVAGAAAVAALVGIVWSLGRRPA